MELTGNLKKKAETAASCDEAKNTNEDAGTLLTEDELDAVSGGIGSDNLAHDSLHDLTYFIQRVVCNVVMYSPDARLTLRLTPNGRIIPGAGWNNGDPILVHGQYTEEGWYFAYHSRTGQFGYVNPNNVC